MPLRLEGYGLIDNGYIEEGRWLQTLFSRIVRAQEHVMLGMNTCSSGPGKIFSGVTGFLFILHNGKAKDASQLKLLAQVIEQQSFRLSLGRYSFNKIALIASSCRLLYGFQCRKVLISFFSRIFCTFVEPDFLRVVPPDPRNPNKADFRPWQYLPYRKAPSRQPRIRFKSNLNTLFFRPRRDSLYLFSNLQHVFQSTLPFSETRMAK